MRPRAGRLAGGESGFLPSVEPQSTEVWVFQLFEGGRLYVGPRLESIEAGLARPGQHIISSTLCQFRLDPSFLKAAIYPFLVLFRRVRAPG